MAKYQSPEAEEMMTKKVDVFAFSLILYEVIAGKVEVVAKEVKERIKRAIGMGKSRSGNRWTLMGIPEFMGKLIIKGLEENPSERPSIEDIFDVFEEHEFKILAGVDTEAVSELFGWVEGN
jgi:hypothetical protein